jgi:hypothetical protein
LQGNGILVRYPDAINAVCHEPETVNALDCHRYNNSFLRQ